MAHEITVPLLPCGSIDEIVEFYTMLGFTRTYYQLRPYPCVGLRREDLQFARSPQVGGESATVARTCDDHRFRRAMMRP